MEGRVALVTGAARGIGRAVSEEFIRSGVRVVMVDNGVAINGTEPDESIIKEVADSLGDQARGICLDVGSSKSAQKAVEVAIKSWGKLDIVVNNAAILRDHFIFKASPKDFEEVVRVNLASAYYILAAATPIFREQAKTATPESPYEWGRIVNIVSTAGFYGNFGQSSYASAKSGLMGLTRTVALDMMRSGITANAIAPFAKSRVTETIIPANDEQKVYKDRAMSISADYVAKVVGAICSDAGRKINGQLIGVRGREVFLFSQPRPISSIDIDSESWDISSVADIVNEEFGSEFLPLKSDLEEFNYEPPI